MVIFTILLLLTIITFYFKKIETDMYSRDAELDRASAQEDHFKRILQHAKDSKPKQETADEKLARLMREHERVKVLNSELTSEVAMLKRTSPFR